MPIINIENVNIGSSWLSVMNKGTRDDQASTLMISYLSETQVVKSTYNYKKEVMVGGIPLALVSLYSDGDYKNYYALDIIKNFNSPDGVIDPSIEGNMPTIPANTTCTLNGNRLSLTKISDRFYLNVVPNTNPSAGEDPYTEIVIMGTPMAKTQQNELLLHENNHTINDISTNPITGRPDLIEVVIGGSPLIAGRINNKYYLIIKEISRDET